MKHPTAKVRLTRWVQEVVYQKDLGTIALRFSQPMVPYLFQLTEQFTRYALTDIARMDSAHAIRLYELLCQWRDAGQREVSIEWLRNAFQLGDKSPEEAGVSGNKSNKHKPKRKSSRRSTQGAITAFP